MRLLILIWALVFVLTDVARGEEMSLKLGGDRYWVVLASRQDQDQAIASASNPRMETRVALAENGWFAAIAGPVTAVKGRGRAVLEGLVKDQGVPKDAYLTQGAGFTSIAWTKPPTNQLGSLSYDGEHDASLHQEGLDITLSRRPDGDGTFVPIATIAVPGKPALRLTMSSDSPNEKPAADIALVRLDPASPVPQVVFTYFWQGAHCCTLTKIATMDKAGAWHVVDGETIDGGGGYAFEDLDGKGFSLLVSADQNFFYAFDSYAGSGAPLRVHQLIGDRLVDVTKAPRLRHRLLQNLYADENAASGPSGDESWHSNGFLAAWVASSMLVGQGETAWTKMLATYDHASDFGPDKCKIAKPIDTCPADKRVKLAFPFALKAFLVDHAYIDDPARYTVPYEVEPAHP